MTRPETLTPACGKPVRTAICGAISTRAPEPSAAHDYKAAAVIAQRVADLVTRTGQPHIYTPLTASSRAGYWPPSPVIEGDNDNHRWQMLTPKIRRLFWCSRMAAPPTLTPTSWRRMARTPDAVATLQMLSAPWANLPRQYGLTEAVMRVLCLVLLFCLGLRGGRRLQLPHARRG